MYLLKIKLERKNIDIEWCVNYRLIDVKPHFGAGSLRRILKAFGWYEGYAFPMKPPCVSPPFTTLYCVTLVSIFHRRHSPIRSWTHLICEARIHRHVKIQFLRMTFNFIFISISFSSSATSHCRVLLRHSHLRIFCGGDVLLCSDIVQFTLFGK